MVNTQTGTWAAGGIRQGTNHSVAILLCILWTGLSPPHGSLHSSPTPPPGCEKSPVSRAELFRYLFAPEHMIYKVTQRWVEFRPKEQTPYSSRGREGGRSLGAHLPKAGGDTVTQPRRLSGCPVEGQGVGHRGAECRVCITCTTIRWVIIGQTDPPSSPSDLLSDLFLDLPPQTTLLPLLRPPPSDVHPTLRLPSLTPSDNPLKPLCPPSDTPPLDIPLSPPLQKGPHQIVLWT